MSRMCRSETRVSRANPSQNVNLGSRVFLRAHAKSVEHDLSLLGHEERSLDLVQSPMRCQQRCSKARECRSRLSSGQSMPCTADSRRLDPSNWRKRCP